MQISLICEPIHQVPLVKNTSINNSLCKSLFRLYIYSDLGSVVWASQEVPVVKNLLSNNARVVGLIPGSGVIFPGVRCGTPLQYSCLKITQAEEPCRVDSTGLQRVGHN